MKRALSIIISFMMMATIVVVPTGSFAEEVPVDDNQAITEAPVDETEGSSSEVQPTEEMVTEQEISIEPETETTVETDEEIVETDEQKDVMPEESSSPKEDAKAIPEETNLEEEPAEEVESEEASQEDGVLEVVCAGEVNPIYEDIIDESEISIPQPDARSKESTSSRAVTYLTTKAAVAEALRDKMKARQSEITVYYKTKSYDGTNQVLYDVFDAAMKHTEVPTEGDYLQWHWQTWGASLTGKVDSGVYYLTIRFDLSYYTTAAQEAKVNTAVKDIIAYLDLNSGKSEYVKVRAIYDYICSNVAYDNDNLNNSAYTLKHSAYAAFINKKAVCQGYALMFYRLALEAGINTRVIAGDYNDHYTGPNYAPDNHGWNIVKIGSKYYNIDSTWDADATPYAHSWFLMGSQGTFKSRHVRWTEYNTTAFHKSYPMHSEDYSVGTLSTPVNISSWKAHLPYTRITEDGTAKKPKVIIPGLVENTDFTVTYSGSKEPEDLSSAGSTVTVTITGTGNYTGTIKKTFYIGKGIVSQASAASLSRTSYTYDGYAKKPTVTVGALKEGTDFTVSYSNNINAGTATVTITGKGKYAGSFTKKFTIKPAAISSIALKTSSYTYNGKYKKPVPTIKCGKKILKSTNYKVTYSKNLYPGRAKVTVKGKGNYTGSLYRTFTIKAPAVAAPKSIKMNLYGYDDFKASWSKVTVTGATVKYKVQSQRYGNGWVTIKKGTKSVSVKRTNLSDGKRYRFRVTPYVTINGKTYKGKTKTSSYVYTLKKISKPKIKKYSKTKIKISWTNISGETGYQIARSTKISKGYKVIKTVKGTKAKSTTIKPKRNKSYYYKVRVYKMVSGKKIYGPWSSPKIYKLK